MSFESTNAFYEVRNSTIARGPYPRDQVGLGENSSDHTLAMYGHYRLWIDDGGEKPGEHWRKQTGSVLVDEVSVPPRCTRSDIWIESSPEQKRLHIAYEIDMQVADGSARQLIEDPSLARSIEATSGGASERKSDLEDTLDGDLDTFDPAIVATPADGAGFIEARMVTWIDHIEPWVGAPGDDLALYVLLEIMGSGDPAAGASARAHMYDHNNVDQGIMSFTQDSGNPSIWRTNSQLGRYWSDENQAARMRLYWNNGSLPVAETRQIKGYGDRQSAIVRAPI